MPWNKPVTYRLAIILLAGSISSAGCYYDKEEWLYPGAEQQASCSAVPASFNADILPLITSNCATSNCHDATASGGLVFQRYEQISAASDKIHTQAIVQKSMPPAGPLPVNASNKLRCWIENGGLNN